VGSLVSETKAVVMATAPSRAEEEEEEEDTEDEDTEDEEDTEETEETEEETEEEVSSSSTAPSDGSRACLMGLSLPVGVDSARLPSRTVVDSLMGPRERSSVVEWRSGARHTHKGC
jgi:hypothetical protein